MAFHVHGFRVPPCRSEAAAGFGFELASHDAVSSSTSFLHTFQFVVARPRVSPFLSLSLSPPLESPSLPAWEEEMDVSRVIHLYVYFIEQGTLEES